VSTRAKAGATLSPEQAAAVNTERFDKGTLIASGFIAGGALMGVVSAILKFCGVDLWMSEGWWTNPLAVLVYIAIIVWFIMNCLKKDGKASR